MFITKKKYFDIRILTSTVVNFNATIRFEFILETLFNYNLGRFAVT